MKPDIGNIDETIRQHLPSAPKREMESHIDHLFDHLQSVPIQIAQEPTARLTRRWHLPAVAAIAATVTLAILVPSRILQSAPAVLEDAAGTRKIHYGEVVRPSGDMSSMLSMTDGPRVEMRSMSEFFLERTGDGGTRIRLSSGDLIVDAAGQHKGNVSVQTKDMMASVSGAVSLIKAEEEGSRVAAIGGEVRVQQGAMEKRLRAGEQAATNPKMERISITEDVAWSREAGTHVALLLQGLDQVPKERPASETRAKFEVVSIRPFVDGPPQPGERNGGPGAGGRGAPTPVACPWIGTVLDPARITAPRITAFRLITWAYEPRACVLEIGLIIGRPAWVMTDLYAFQATMPAGTPAYGFRQLQKGEAPKLQEMLQTMLEDRFKLKFHREKKEVPAFDLVVAKPGKMTPSKDQTPPADPSGGNRGFGVSTDDAPPPGATQLGLDRFRGTSITVADLAREWGARAARPVIDKTGLTGFFDINVPIVFDVNEILTRARGQGGTAGGAGLLSADAQILEALGLKLEPSKTTVEVIVIDHIEKPSEN